MQTHIHTHKDKNAAVILHWQRGVGGRGYRLAWRTKACNAAEERKMVED